MSGIRFTRRKLLGSMAAGALFAPHIAHSQTGKATPVTIGNAQGSLNVTLQEMMKQNRYLEEFGLQPEVIGVADGSKIASGLLGGSLDLSTMSGFGQIFPAIEKGAKIKILGGACLLPTLAMYSAKPEIKTLKDLEGRTVGTGSIGALVHQLTVTLLRKYKVDDTKVKFINIGSTVDIFKGTVVGTVDAGAGELAVLEDAAKLNIHALEHGNMALELDEYTYQGAWTSDDAIARDRDKLVRTLAAYAKLYRYVQTPAAKADFYKARKAIFPSEAEDQSAANWNLIQKYKPYTTDLFLNEARMNYMQQLNVDGGSQTKIVPYNQVTDMSLARDAVALLDKKS